MADLNVNSRALIRYTAALDKLHRSDLPIAIRNTLNNAAFDVKRNTLHKSAKQNFAHIKQQNFFKRFSGVDKAVGFNINSMRSTVGMQDSGQRSAKTAIGNMMKQEIGGVIDDGFSYLKGARGEKLHGKVLRENYYDKNKVVSGRSRVGKGSLKSKFVARAYRSYRENKPMFINTVKGNFLMKVTAIWKKGRRGTDGIKIKTQLLMKEREAVTLKPTKFMTEAAKMTQKKISYLYVIEAQKRINKVMKL